MKRASGAVSESCFNLSCSLQDDDPLRSNHSQHHHRVEEEEKEGRENSGSGPDSSHLVRRGALVPGKIVGDGEEQDENNTGSGNAEQ